MGYTYWTRCLDCGIDGPEVGDAGFVGAPSLERERGDGSIAPFGHILEAFEACGLVTPDLEEQAGFLAAHAGHAVHSFSDGDARFPLPPADPMAGSGQARGDWVVDFPPRGFAERALRLRCAACDEEVEADEPDWVRPRRARTLSPAECELFATRVGAALEESLRHYEPFGDALPAIVAFLTAHGAHGVRLAFAR